MAPIFASSCMGCHQPSGIAPFSLTTYEDAQTYALLARDAIGSGVMPPFSAADAADCAPPRNWMDDPTLDAEQRTTLDHWIEDGFALGDVADVAIPAAPKLAGKTHDLTINPYVTAGNTDEFICFLLDPATTQDAWVTGWHVVPGNASVVHHAVVFTLPAVLMPAARDVIGVGNPLPCSAGAGVGGSVAIGAWAPGGQPFDSGADVGTKLAAGDGVIVQLHYHPAGKVNEPDATTVELRLATTAPTHELTFASFGNARSAPTLQPGPYDPTAEPVFEIPANVNDAVETMKFTVPDGASPLALFSAFPHMHYVGVKLSVWVHRAAPAAGEPATECLVNVNRWNFNWQRQYRVDAPLDALPEVRGGDTVEMRCSYDNTLANPFVQRALAENNLSWPVTVTLGEETLDEMCIASFGVIARAQ